MNAMLSTDKFPQSNKDWEDLEVTQRMWARWKTTYHAAEKKADMKKKSARGKYQFGAAHITTPLIASAPMGSYTKETAHHWA